MAIMEYRFEVKRRDRATLGDGDKSAIEGLMLFIAIDRLMRLLYEAEEKQNEDLMDTVLQNFHGLVKQYGRNGRLHDCIETMATMMGYEISELAETKRRGRFH
jgi:DNA-binding GntR family transcriptional regulator